MPSAAGKPNMGLARVLGVPAALVLTLFLFLPQAFRPGFLLASLDLSNIYYPAHEWMNAVLSEGRLPLITDLAYHGAPVAGLSILGFLSPLFWLVHAILPPSTAFQFLFLLPLLSLLLGCFFLGRKLGLSQSASFLLSILLTYHGRNMAQLDHLNVQWANAFFPWALLCALQAVRKGGPVPALGAGLLSALGLLSGHPQMVWLQVLFFPFFLFGVAEGTARRKWTVLLLAASSAALFSAPFLLHSAETLFFDRPNLSWSPADRFYHSWTPLNPLTLLFPWFFGRTAYDGTSDYWFQYQFVEMQMALSAAGLFFALLFFLQKDRKRLPLGLAVVLFFYLSMGKFSILYRALQGLPFLGDLRSPARYAYPAVWALGFSAAFGWDRWFSGGERPGKARSLIAGLTAAALGVLGALKLLTGPFRPQLETLANGLVEHFILADPTYPHRQDPSFYVGRISGKVDLLSRSCDLTRPEVFLPLCFLVLVLLAVWRVPRGKPLIRQSLLLILVLADLWVFRMPSGDAWLKASGLPSPVISAPESRMISHVSGTTSPSPQLARFLCYPNSNLPFRRQALDIVLGSFLPRYDVIEARLGWFAWVYKERKLFGFLDHPNLLRVLGVDLCVSDVPIPAKEPFKTVSPEFPYAMQLEGVRPKAFFVRRVSGHTWPDMIDDMERGAYDPLRDTFQDLYPDNSDPSSYPPPRTSPVIEKWSDIRAVIETREKGESFLVLQKSWLPAWKATVNGRYARIYRCDGVLTGFSLPPGPCRVELEYRPMGLKLGIFVFLLALSSLAALTIRSFIPTGKTRADKA